MINNASTFLVKVRDNQFYDSFYFLTSLDVFSAALEPFFNAAASQFILGHQIPLSLWLSLAPVVFGNSFDFDLLPSIFFSIERTEA